MEPLVYVMAILGCGDLGDQCRPLRELPARYASADACRAASADMLRANSDLDAPEVTAECYPRSSAPPQRLASARP